MVSLLKTFGKGILYVIGLPFFLVALVLFGVFGLFAFIFQLFKSIIYFFTGQKFFPDLPEDKQLKLLKEGPQAEKQEDMPMEREVTPREEEKPLIYPYVQEPPREEPVPEEQILSRMTNEETVEEACFGKPEEEPATEEVEESIEETPVEEESCDSQEEYQEEEIVQDEEEKESNAEEDVVETSNDESEEEQEEGLEVYVPKSSNYNDNIFDDDEDTDDDNGVDIRFDV